MTKSTIPAIQRELKNLKKLIPTQSVCFTFIEETEKDSVFLVHENIYRSRADPMYRSFEIEADTAQDAGEKYHFPAGCSMENSVIFTFDYGE